MIVQIAGKPTAVGGIVADIIAALVDDLAAINAMDNGQLVVDWGSDQLALKRTATARRRRNVEAPRN